MLILVVLTIMFTAIVLGLIGLGVETVRLVST